MWRDLEAESNRYRIEGEKRATKIGAMLDELFQPKESVKKKQKKMKNAQQPKAVIQKPNENFEGDCFHVFDQSLNFFQKKPDIKVET